MVERVGDTTVFRPYRSLDPVTSVAKLLAAPHPPSLEAARAAPSGVRYHHIQRAFLRNRAYPGLDGAVLTTAALLTVCSADPSPAGARDAALIALPGLRRAEMAALELADYSGAERALAVRHGKGRKARIVYAAEGTAHAIADWLAERGDAPGALFCPVNKGGRITIRAMTEQAIFEAMHKRAQQARIARFSPHDLRRTYISQLLDTGADLATVQQLAGHASVQTTVRYDRRGDRAKQRASERLHVPYVPRQRRRATDESEAARTAGVPTPHAWT